MAQTRKMFFLSYIVLVGLPLLGLLATLEAGRTLRAPVSVGGTWDLQADLSAAQTQTCPDWLGSARPTTLDISQSGRYLTCTLSTQPKVALQATLDGNTVAGDSTAPSSSKVEANCNTATGVSLRAEIDLKAEPRVISGVLSVNECSSCGTVHFRAVRQVPSAGKRSE